MAAFLRGTVAFVLGLGLANAVLASRGQAGEARFSAGKGQVTAGDLVTEQVSGMQDSVVGEVIADGVLCPRFRIDGGEEISLEALPVGAAEVRTGDRLRLAGQFLRASRCMQGRGFRVVSLTGPLPAPED